MYYIVTGKDGRPTHGWAHHGVRGGGKGCWATDIDAEYSDEMFGYKRVEQAMKKAAILGPEVDRLHAKMKTPSGFTCVVTRKRLFDLLGVEDWSHGSSF